MQTIRITTSQNIDIDYEVAGVGERTLARLIDFALFVVIYILGLILFAIGASRAGSATFIIVLIIIYAALFVFYDLICEITTNGQSLGKRVMKIKVVSLDGARPTLSQYLLRWLFRIVDFTLTLQAGGLITAAVSEKQQRIGDIVAGTTLIKTNPRTTKKNLVFTPVANDYIPVFNNLSQLNDRDITLIQEVIRNYRQHHNILAVNNTAERVKELLSITQANDLDDVKFLQTIVKDYTHAATQTDV